MPYMAFRCRTSRYPFHNLSPVRQSYPQFLFIYPQKLVFQRADLPPISGGYGKSS